MKQNKNKVMIGIIYAIVFVVYNIVVFTLFRAKTPVFWISYLLVVLAFVLHFITTRLAFRDSAIETSFYGIPLASISTFYLLAQIGVSIIFIIFQQMFSGTGITKAAVVIQVVMLAIFIVVAIIAIMSRDAVQAVNDTVREKVTTHKTTLFQIEMIRDTTTHPELKNAVGKLVETVKYSDPITNESIADVDARIEYTLNELRVYSDANQTQEALAAVKDLELMYLERNRILFISK